MTDLLTAQAYTSQVQNYCFRLKPDQDLKKELLSFAQKHHLKAAVIISSVGSLKKAHIRLSGGKDTVEYNGPFEIVSLTGTLSAEAVHLHISFSDFDGRVRGGHLMDGSPIFTTAEIILQENMDLKFSREMDSATGYQELTISRRQ
jgi:predicted DNA-binding protein with PD1-like motif